MNFVFLIIYFNAHQVYEKIKNKTDAKALRAG